MQAKDSQKGREEELEEMGAQLERKAEELQTNNETNLKTIHSHSSFQTAINKFKRYQPRSNCIDLAHLKQSKWLRLKKSKQYAYYGEIVNNVRQGAGIMLYGNCGVYQGSWLMDMRHGRGYQFYENGNSYEGQFVEGKRQGIGRFLWKNGQFYEGQWLQNKKEGSGNWKSPQGDSYLGQWKDNKTHGFGVRVWRNGDRYQGHFVDSLKHGQGYWKLASGDLYKGHFQRGLKDGYGEYFWADGSSFRGEFKNGQKDGKGTWVSRDEEEQYEGSYENGKREGYGVYVWADGIVYKGQFKQDLKEGYGEMYWPSGQYYKGHWRADLQHGQAQTYAPSIGIKRCSFVNNAIVEALQEEEQPDFAQQSQQKQLARNGQKIYNSRALRARFNTIQDTPIKNQQLSRIYLSSNRKEHNNFSSTNKNGRKTNRSKSTNPKDSKRLYTLQKHSKVKLQVNQTKKNTLDLSSRKESPIYAQRRSQKKDQIPHSSYYMQLIHQRVNSSLGRQGEEKPYLKTLSQHKFQPQATPDTKSFNLTKLMHKFRLSRYRPS